MPAKNTINISLTDEQVIDIEYLMSSGEYASKAEIFRRGLDRQIERFRFKKMVDALVVESEKETAVEVSREEMRQRLYDHVEKLKSEQQVTNKEAVHAS